MPIVVDIWGGHHSQDHLARFYRPMKQALAIAYKELEAGFLVNMRQEAAWGPENDFDNRSKAN